MIKSFTAFFIINFYSFILVAQNGTIKGRVYNYINNEPIPFANIVIKGTQEGVVSDLEGNYVFSNIKPGLYNFEAFVIGFKNKVAYEIEVTSSKGVELDFPLEQSTQELTEVEVKASPFNKTEESPLSLRTIGVAEIQRSPGGNRDISKVIQNLPGVASTPSFRNDIIIRGGAPNENRFFLDGVEIPNINHFATQGSSGGPVGMLNVNFINEVDYYAGAFPANRGNSLSSVFEFKQKEGNQEKLSGNFMLGSSDVGLTLDGPIGKKQNFIFSVRRSYLQFLFTALKLPFLPTYNDYQLKHTIKFNQKNQVSIISIGALDDFAFNTSANKGVTDSATINRNTYILGNIPLSKQWNYAVGAVYKHFSVNSYQTIVVSRNSLNNTATKYFNNEELANNLLLRYTSRETENKIRIENFVRTNHFKINYGLGFEHVEYTNATFNKQVIVAGNNSTLDFNSKLTFQKYAAFAQISKVFFSRLTTSLGLRSDANNYSSEMANPLDQLSPRLSLSYALTEKFNINFNTGRYYQLPAYTIMGYKNNANDFINKANGLKYISVNHIVGGLEYNSSFNSKITVEGFYKTYQNYPFSLINNVSLANLGADFGVIGNEPVTSTSKGRTYGIEFLFQQKLSKGFYGILSYTYVKSEFSGNSGKYIPSAWDFGNILNLVGGKRFKNNWELGLKFRYSGGAPYTPVNVGVSSLKNVWDVLGQGVLDYSQLNTQRSPANHQVDIRLDKRYYFTKWLLNIYIDVQNVYANKVVQPSFIDVVRDLNGKPVTDSNNPALYQTKLVANTSSTVLPSIGIMIQF